MVPIFSGRNGGEPRRASQYGLCLGRNSDSVPPESATRAFGGNCCLHLEDRSEVMGLEPGPAVSSVRTIIFSPFYTEDGDNSVMRSLGGNQPDYTVSRSSRQAVFVKIAARTSSLTRGCVL
jgi:hypothetical protein